MLDLAHLERYRLKSEQVIRYFGSVGDKHNGIFVVPYGGKGSGGLRVIAASDGGWDHLSVTVADERRCPTWEEMCYVKEQFLGDRAVAMQLHPPAEDNINCHPYCLHIWSPWFERIPLPPKEFVA